MHRRHRPAGVPAQQLYLRLWRGWSLYAERLGDDMGFYRTPHERFGMLSYDTVLSFGSVPLPVLETRIDRFTGNGGKGPYLTET